MWRRNGISLHSARMLLLPFLLMATLLLPVSVHIATAPAAQGAAFCTQQYAPVCAERRGLQQTYANACFARAAKARILHAGACGQAQPPANGCNRPADPARDALCKSWTDGCNICRRSRPGGPARCTKMACRTTTAPRCLLRFGEKP